MYPTIQQFKTLLEGKLHGTTLNKYSSVNEKIGSAASMLLLRLDPPGTKRRHRIENAIHNRVYNYVAPSDIKGVRKIVDIRPIEERESADTTRGTSSREFDVRKERNSMAVEVIGGVKTLRISKELGSRATLFSCDTLTSGATVAGSGDVENLEVEQVDYVSGNGAIRFGLSGNTGSGAITITLDSAVDLSANGPSSSIFWWNKFLSAGRIQSMNIRYGTDASNYFEQTVTSPHDRSDFVDNAYTLQRSDAYVATQVGTVDWTSIQYIRVTFTYTAGVPLTRNYIDAFTISRGKAYEMLYYSNCLFTNSAGTVWKQTPTEDSDIIMLEHEALSILIYETLKLLAQESQGKNLAADIQFAELALEGNQKKPGLYEQYQKDNPSEAAVFQETYHQFGRLE